ncbi:MAG: ribosome small subunit-dependent GTPase A [Oscillospiraceae bacterium]
MTIKTENTEKSENTENNHGYDKSLDGRIIKGIGGFYYVDTECGVFECRARGIFRHENMKPLVGDIVKITANMESLKGSLDTIEPRENCLLRPHVANVTQMATVIATTNPKPNLVVVDKLIASAEYANIIPLICINKMDLDGATELVKIYSESGFEVVELSAEKGINIEKLTQKLDGNVTVFAGNSGVGKSSLLNCIVGKYSFETGITSAKVERGKHTTRHSELVALKTGGYIIDTPGFSSFELEDVEANRLCELFREFEDYRYSCKFRDCSHTVEKGCAVLEALKNHKISESRHRSYVKLYEELKAHKEY